MIPFSVATIVVMAMTGLIGFLQVRGMPGKAFLLRIRIIELSNSLFVLYGYRFVLV